MNPKDTFPINNLHSIEWGEATWDNKDFSIRNRLDNKKGGGFNKFGSSEIQWDDFNRMVTESIRRNHFTNIELSVILNEISKKIKTLK